MIVCKYTSILQSLRNNFHIEEGSSAMKKNMDTNMNSELVLVIKCVTGGGKSPLDNTSHVYILHWLNFNKQ